MIAAKFCGVLMFTSEFLFHTKHYHYIYFSYLLIHLLIQISETFSLLLKKQTKKRKTPSSFTYLNVGTHLACIYSHLHIHT